MSQFQIGQTVKLIKKKDDGLSAEIGDLGKIDDLTDDNEYPIDVHWIETDVFEAVHPSEITIVEEDK